MAASMPAHLQRHRPTCLTGPVQISIYGSNIWNMLQETNGPGFSQSLERGLAILWAFTPDPPAILAIPHDTDVILMGRVRGRPGRYPPLEFSLHVGSRLPSYCSATGKALLAYLPQPDLDRLLDRMELVQRGPRTLTDKKSLIRELEKVRCTNIATNDEELESALRSIAAPIRSRSGQVVAAVNLAIPWSPAAMSELVSRLGPTVRAAANRIAAQVV